MLISNICRYHALFPNLKPPPVHTAAVLKPYFPTNELQLFYTENCVVFEPPSSHGESVALPWPSSASDSHVDPIFLSVALSYIAFLPFAFPR